MVNRYFNITNILLITAGVYLLVSGFYSIVTAKFDYGASPTLSTPSGHEPAPVNTPKAPLSKYHSIVDRNLFNTDPQEAAVTPQPKKVDLETLKETDLKLKLWGTVSRQGGAAYAVIEDTKTREQNLYRTGDNIQNATVKIILREKVVLTVNESDEILTMEEIATSKKSQRSVRKDLPGSRLPVSSYARKITLNRANIESALENIGQLMDQATIRPHIEDGRPAGISITGIRPNAIFRKMRLRNGDVITGVNGRAIESVDDAVSVFEDLTSSSEIKVDIKRRGRRQTLDYKIE
jgi:general secretion pathway protein C